MLIPAWVVLALFGQPWIAAVALLGSSLLLLLTFLHRGKHYLLRQTMRCLVRSRQLAAISVVCITISVAGASVTMTVHDSLDGYSKVRSESVMGSADLVLGLSGPSRETFHLTESKLLLKDLQGLEDVTSAEPIILGEAPVLGGNNAGIVPNTGFMGVFDDAVIALGGFTTLDGRTIRQEPGADQAYVNPSFLGQLGVHEGDLIFLLLGNTTCPLRVSELITTSSLGGYGGDRPFIFINMNTAAILMDRLGACNAVAVGLSPTSEREIALASISEVLERHPELSMEIEQDKAAEAYRSSSVLGAPVAVLLMFGILSLILGMAVLNNLYRLMMEDRRQDLSILRSLGLSRRDTILAMMDEGLALGALGAVLGTVVGIALSAVCLNLLREATIWGWGVPVLLIVDPLSVLCCVLFGMGSVLLVTYVSSRSVLNFREQLGTKRSSLPVMVAASFLVAALCLARLSFNMAIVLALTAGLLTVGHLPGGRGALAGPVMAFVVLIWAILTEGAASYTVLGSAFLITSVMMAGSLLPVLLRKWSGQGRRGGPRSRLAAAYLSHPASRLKASLMTFSSIFVLLTVTTGLSGMVIMGTERTMDQGSWDVDSMAFRNGLEPFESGLWGQVNRTQGALYRENISMIAPVYSEVATISLSFQLSTAIGNTMDYGVYGLDEDALSLIDMPLSEFDQEQFSSSSAVWEKVLRSSDIAIIDSNLRYDLIISGQGDRDEVRLGDVISIHNAEGRSANVTVVGVTEQRLIGGVFVNPLLLTEFLGLSGPNIYFIDYAPGLDSREQDQWLEADTYSDGVTVINLAGKARGITEGMADVTLAMHVLTFTGVLLGALGAFALSLRTVRDRRTDIANLRSMGMLRAHIGTSMLIESALTATIGLVGGLLSGVIALVGLWELFFKPMNIGLHVDWPTIVTIDVAALSILFLAFFLLFHCASRSARSRPGR